MDLQNLRFAAADKSVTVPTTGIMLLSSNNDREWAAFVNLGFNSVDLEFIGIDDTVKGHLWLLQYGSIVLSKYGDMPWFGGLRGTAQGAATAVRGIEVSGLR